MSDTTIPEGAPAPEAKPSPPEPSTPSPEPTPDNLLAAARNEAITERKARQALEQRLSELETAQMSEQERAVKEAEARGRTVASAEYAQLIAAAKIEARLAGIVPDPSAVVAHLNLSRYLGEDGQVDMAKVEEYVALIPPPSQPAPPSVPTGPRGGEPAGWTLERVRQVSKTHPEQVEAARQRGDLDHLFGP